MRKYHISFTHSENGQFKQDFLTTGAKSSTDAVKQVYKIANVISINKIEEITLS